MLMQSFGCSWKYTHIDGDYWQSKQQLVASCLSPPSRLNKSDRPCTICHVVFLMHLYTCGITYVTCTGKQGNKFHATSVSIWGSFTGLRAWYLFINPMHEPVHTLSNILNIFSNLMWKRDNNLLVKLKIFLTLSLHKLRERLSLQELMPANSGDQCVHRLRFA